MTDKLILILGMVTSLLFFGGLIFTVLEFRRMDKEDEEIKRLQGGPD